MPGAYLEWDARGNLTRKGDLLFGYDERNRLKEVQKGGEVIATYAYDPLDRRVEKTAGGITTRTVWDGWQSIEDYAVAGDGTKILIGRRTYGQGLDEIVQLETSPDSGATLKKYTLLYDAVGHVAALAEPDGQLVERYEYSPYGDRKIWIRPASLTLDQLRVSGTSVVLELSGPIEEPGLEEAQSSGTPILENLTQG
ncbi:MAG: hypothetical protein MPN21_28150, partial [Thermoanaerobaculia bacterium]|nr:hypothetical protein [Thermoanaerobaculia bacterium]